jgi:O-antigen/teichoic acid export membrane protein
LNSLALQMPLSTENPDLSVPDADPAAGDVPLAVSATADPAGTAGGAAGGLRGLLKRIPPGQALGLVVLTSAANVVNYASSLAFSRVLEPVGFGELTSLLALSIVLGVPLGAAQTVLAERIATARAAGDEARVRYLIRYALGHVTVLAVICGLIYVACIPLVVEALGIREPGPAIALAPLLVLGFVNIMSQGVLQGMERFAAFGVLIFGMAVSRIGFGLPWAWAGGGAGGAIAGQALGILIVHGLLAWRYRAWLIGRGTGAASSGARRRIDLGAVSASGAFVGFALLSNLDLVLSRVYLDGEAAGIYAALATVAKIVIFLPSAVTIFLVPSAARAKASTGSGAQTLRLAGLLVAGAAVACAIPALLAPGLLIDVMFGAGYEAAVEGVLPAVIAGAGLSFLYVICVYSVTIRDRRWIFLLAAGVALQVTMIALLHDSPEQIAWAQAITAILVLLGNEIFFHSLIPRRRLRSA